MANNMKEFGSQHARLKRNSLRDHTQSLNQHVPLSAQILEEIKMTARDMFHNRTLDMLFRQDIEELVRQLSTYFMQVFV